jgi:hypothetical protein
VGRCEFDRPKVAGGGPYRGDEMGWAGQHAAVGGKKKKIEISFVFIF